VAWEGAVFRRVLEAARAAVGATHEAGRAYCIGVDWGRSLDYTVFAVFDATTRIMVALKRSNRVDYTVQRDRLRALCEKWRPGCIVAEANSIGQPIIEQLASYSAPAACLCRDRTRKRSWALLAVCSCWPPGREERPGNTYLKIRSRQGFHIAFTIGRWSSTTVCGNLRFFPR
jgi:hypothetical protein